MGRRRRVFPLPHQQWRRDENNITIGQGNQYDLMRNPNHAHYVPVVQWDEEALHATKGTIDAVV